MFKTIFLVMFIFSCVSMILASVDTGEAKFSGRDAAGETTGSNDWEQYYDARLSFTLEHPAGWTVQSKGYTVTVQSPDHSSFVMVEAFVSKQGQTAKSCVSNISSSYPTLFPAAHLDQIAQQPSTADMVVGALTYQSANGQPGQIRALCSIYQGSGILYTLSSPNNRFASEQPTLLKVLTSLRFGVTSLDKSTGAGRGVNSTTDNTTAGNSIRFTRWNDPKEQAFSVEVPEGWSVDGGTTRPAPTDYRQVVQMASPDKDMMIRYGDRNLPRFLLPTSLNMQMFHVREGMPFAMGMFQAMLLRYMPARSFNEWYLNMFIKQNMSDFSITRTEELPEASSTQTEAMVYASNAIGMQGNFQVTVAQTEFTGRNKSTGKMMVGIIISTVALSEYPQQPNMQTSWTAKPIVMACAVDDQTEIHKAMIIALADHLNQTWQINPVWQKNYSQQLGQGTAQVKQWTDAMTKAANERAAQHAKPIASDTEMRHQSLMDSFWAKNNAKADFNRKFNNYVSDQTDVSDPDSGRSYKVGSGYNNYYLDSRRGVIVGTNSASRPSVDFSLMTQY